MPWQLKRGLANRVKGVPPRPIIENLDAIPVHKLPIPSLNDAKTYIIPHISLTFPWICGCKVARDKVQFTRPSVHRGQTCTQEFRLKHIRAGYFGVRHAFICTCGKPTLKLYFHNRFLGCKRCHNARRASDAVNQQQRPILQANRIQSFLDGKPRLMRKTRDRLLKRLGQKAMMAQGRMGTKAQSLLD